MGNASAALDKKGWSYANGTTCSAIVGHCREVRGGTGEEVHDALEVCKDDEDSHFRACQVKESNDVD